MPKSMFPVDIFAVKEYGVERWLNEFYWPVSDAEYIKLCDDVERLFAEYINMRPEEIGDLLLMQAGLRSDYWQFLHAIKVASIINSRKERILYSGKTLWYGDILENNFNSVESSVIERANLLGKARAEIAGHIRSLIYNIKFFKQAKINKGKDTVEVYGSPRSIITEYIGKSHERFSFASREQILLRHTAHELSVKIKSGLETLSGEIVKDLNVIARNNEITLQPVHIRHLQELTLRRMVGAAKLMRIANEDVSNKKTSLLVANFSYILFRALCIANRRKGNKVCSFSHGGNIGLYDTPVFSFSEFALSDEFITYTGESAVLYGRSARNHPPLKGNAIKIRSCESSEFLQLWNLLGAKKPPKKIKRVMLVGFPHHQLRNYQVPGGLSLIKLDFELRITNFLKSHGYEVVYKTHPDRILEARGVFEGRAKVSEGYFEDCIDAADAFLFGSIQTTTFPAALCTNKPVIALFTAEEISKISPEAAAMLMKRCVFVNARFDDRNRIIFDKETILAALSKEPKKVDDGFLRTYMFPSEPSKS